MLLRLANVLFSLWEPTSYIKKLRRERRERATDRERERERGRERERERANACSFSHFPQT